MATTSSWDLRWKLLQMSVHTVNHFSRSLDQGNRLRLVVVYREKWRHARGYRGLVMSSPSRNRLEARSCFGKILWTLRLHRKIVRINTRGPFFHTSCTDSDATLPTKSKKFTVAFIYSLQVSSSYHKGAAMPSVAANPRFISSKKRPAWYMCINTVPDPDEPSSSPKLSRCLQSRTLHVDRPVCNGAKAMQVPLLANPD